MQKSLKSRKREEEEVDDNLVYNFIPVSHNHNPTAMMSQSMASIHRSSPPSSSNAFISSSSHSDHDETTNNKPYRSSKQTKHNRHSPSEAVSSQSQSFHNRHSPSEAVSSQSFHNRNPEEGIFNDHHFQSNRTTVLIKSERNRKVDKEVTYRDNHSDSRRKNVESSASHSRDHPATETRYSLERDLERDLERGARSDDLVRKKKNFELMTTTTESSLLINRPSGESDVDDEQTRINKEILFPLFDTILSQSESE